MNFVLTREHLGQIVRFDSLTVVTLPEQEFKQGDILVFFNNTEKFATLDSKVQFTYRSSMPKSKTHLEIPPRALVNIVFVDDNIAVLTVGM
jgi:hypothetical protein